MKSLRFFLSFVVGSFISCSSIAQCVPSVSISIVTGSNPGCTDSLLGFTTTTNNLGINPTFSWFVNGIIQSDTTSIFTSATLNDGDSIYAIAYGDGCTTSDTAVAPGVKLSLNSAPLDSFVTNHPHPCPGDTIILSALDNASSNSYQWKLDGVPIPGATKPTYVVPPLTTGFINLTVANGGCSKTSSNPVFFGLIVDIPPFIFPNPLNVICPGDSLVLQVYDTDTPYQWSLNGAIIPGVTGNIYYAKLPGIYTVSDLFSGCLLTSSGVTLRESTIPNISVSASQTMFCAGDSALLIANYDPAFNSWWQVNGVNISIPNNYPYYPDYIAKSSGAYHLIVTNSDGCSTLSADIQIDVNPLPNPVINVSGNTLSTGIFLSYQWNYNGMPIRGATKNSYTATQAGGIYTVTVTDANGCQNTSVGFPPVTGVTNVSSLASSIKIYPDPATSVINISSPINVNISLITTDGKTVLTKNNATQIDISALDSGYYTIRITDTDGNFIKMDKIVKM